MLNDEYWFIKLIMTIVEGMVLMLTSYLQERGNLQRLLPTSDAHISIGHSKDNESFLLWQMMLRH